MKKISLGIKVVAGCRINNVFEDHFGRVTPGVNGVLNVNVPIAVISTVRYGSRSCD